MSMNAGDIVFYINGDDAQLQGVLRNIDRSFSQTGRNIGLAMGAAGAAITGALGLSANAAMDWESAFIGVKKTTNATVEQFAALEKGLIDLSTQIPVSATELAKLAEIGGQMGVPQEQLLAFTKTIAILGETTNLAGEEGAAMLAQFANVAQVPQSQYSNLAAAIVDLGNAGTSTEAEILAMGLRIAGAGSIAGMSAGDILGFSNALVGVGIEAQAGGTAMSKLIIGIASSVAKGGKSLEGFAKVAGVSAQQFAEAFKNDPAQAIAGFIQGLAKIKNEGGNLFGVLDKLGIKESIMRDVMLRATQAADGMAASVALGNTAFEANNAHLVEAEKRFASTESQITLFKNSVWALSKVIGDALLPGINARLGMFKEWALDLKAAAEAHPGLVAQLVSFASVLGTVLIVAGTVIAALPGIAIAFGAITWPAVAAGLAIGALIGAFAAVAVAVYEWAQEWMAIPGNMEKVNTFLGAAQAAISAIWGAIVGVFRSAVDAVKGVLGEFSGSVGMNWEGITALFWGAVGWITNALGVLGQGIGAAFTWIGGIIAGAVEWLGANWEQIGQIFSNAVDGILLVGGMLWEGLKLTFSLLWEFLSRVFGEIGEGWKEIAGVAGDESKTWLDVIQIMQEKTLDFLGEVSKGFERFTDFVYYIWPVISTAFEIGANLVIEPLMNMLDVFYWVMDQVTWLMKKLGGAWDWLNGASGFAGGINISGPPGMATGGVVQRGGWAMVGERGPEMVKLPKGSTVYDARQTAAAGGGGTTVIMNNTFHGVTDMQAISRELGRQVELELRGRGI